MKIKQTISIIILTISLIIPNSMMIATATDTIDINTMNAINIDASEDTATSQSVSGETYNSDNELPKVTIDDASTWANNKQMDIIRLMQRIVQPFAVILFGVGAIMTVVCTVIHSKHGNVGIIVMFTSIIMLAAVKMAPEIVTYGFQWLTSK